VLVVHTAEDWAIARECWQILTGCINQSNC
jgi:hypothetical protein